MGALNALRVGRFPITIDKNKTLEELLKNYDSVNPEINSYIFSPALLEDRNELRYRVNVELIQFPDLGIYSLDNVESVLSLKLSRRLATLREIITLGVQYPNEQKKHMIVTLGVLWRLHSTSNLKEIYLSVDPDGKRFVEMGLPVLLSTMCLATVKVRAYTVSLKDRS